MKVNLKQMDLMNIHQKQQFIQDFYEKVLFSPCGIVYSMQKIDGDEIRPFEEKDFEGCEAPEFKNWGDRAPENASAYYTGENSISTSGLYLAAQCYRYKATGNQAALEQAYKAYNSLCLIYKLTEEDGNPGFFCKPYGFKISNQTSGDQYLHSVWGLLEFHPYADSAAQKQIEKMVVSFADYWIKNDYVLTYFGVHWDMKDDDYSYNAILTLLDVAAYHFTKDQKYMSEAKRIFSYGKWHLHNNREAAVKARLAQLEGTSTDDTSGAFDKTFREHLGEDEFVFWESTCLSQFVGIAADLIYRMVPEFLAPFMSHLNESWLSNWSIGMGEGYAPYYWFCINARTGAWRPFTKTNLLPKEQWRFSDRFYGYLSEIRWGEPLARFVLLSVVAYPYVENKAEAKEIHKNLLNAVDSLKIRWMFDFDGKQLEPELRHHYNILSSEVPASWLASYWRGKCLGIID